MFAEDGLSLEREAALHEALERAKANGLYAESKMPAVVQGMLDEGSTLALLATDAGNAELFARMFAGKVAFVHGLGWYVWTGKRWQEDPHESRVTEMMKSLAHVWVDIGKALLGTNDAEANRAFKQALRIRSRAAATAALDFVSKERGIFHAGSPFDVDPMLLNTQTGILDLRTGQLLQHDPRYMCSRICGVAYDPNAQAPRWNRFLREVFAGDEAMIRFVRRFLGYSLTGNMCEQRYLIAWGVGANGKSTLYDAVRHVMGDYAATISTEALMMKRTSDNVNSDIAQLAGVRLAVAPEWDDSLRANEVLLKSITGGDPVRVRKLFRDSVELRLQCKIHIFGNHKPELRGRDAATWRRPLLVPFTESFRGREDRDLATKLRAEGEGILADLVRACGEWQAEGLAIPEAVERATAKFRAEMDDLRQFIEDACVNAPGATVQVGRLHEAYRAAGGRIKQSTAFTQALRELGFEARATNRGRIIEGLGLLANESSGGYVS